jgi:hypothetical protein
MGEGLCSRVHRVPLSRARRAGLVADDLTSTPPPVVWYGVRRPDRSTNYSRRSAAAFSHIPLDPNALPSPAFFDRNNDSHPDLVSPTRRLDWRQHHLCQPSLWELGLY